LCSQRTDGPEKCLAEETLHAVGPVVYALPDSQERGWTINQKQPRIAAEARRPQMAEAKQHKDERYRAKCFPGSELEVMTPKKGGYFPVATVSRKLLKYMKDSELRVWMYLQARAGKWFITYPTYEEIQLETGLSKGAVSKAVKGLELKGFIRSCNDVGTRRYLIRDPRLAMLRLRELDVMSPADFDDANYLLEVLKQPTVADPPGKPQQAMSR
jgi:hypothetical protein